MDKHTIIIGSGLGGLACGYILAKNGYRVTILEKNAQLGGCLQTFVRHGVKFETGMHYIGSMDEGQVLHRFFRYLSLFADVKLSPLDRQAYDTITIGDRRFCFANGVDSFVEQLAQQFPNERQNLHRYWHTIKDVAQHSPLYSLQYDSSMRLLSPTYIMQSASNFIDSTIADPLLRAVLAGNLPLYAGVQGVTPLYTHALVNDFYNQSTYRIVGSSGCIAQSLVKSIRAMGGTVRANAAVSKISCDELKATSVSLRDGEEIRGDCFISNVHPVRLNEMLDTHLFRKAYRDRIDALENTVGNFTVYIEFKKNTVPYLNTNSYYYRNASHVWQGTQDKAAQTFNSFLYMHLCTAPLQQFAEGAILMTYMSYKDVAEWKGTPIGQRGEAYSALKQQKAEQLLALLEQQFPGTHAGIERFHTSTPLTYEDYTGTKEGSMYGILRNCNEPVKTQVSQRTKVPNLFQTGQNINSHGILGTIIGAIITSGELLGVGNVVKQIKET
jgi:all-trans-retinol 13,14-reductase